MQAPHSESSQPSFAPVSPTRVADGVEERRPRRQFERVGVAVHGQGQRDRHAAPPKTAVLAGTGTRLAARAGHGHRERAPGHDLRHRPAVVGGGADVRDRLGRGGRGLRRLPHGVGASVGAGQRLGGLGHEPDRRRERRDRDAGPLHGPAGERDRRGRSDDRDLHLPPVLQPDVGAARPVVRQRDLDAGEELVRRRSGRAGAGHQLRDRHLPLAGTGPAGSPSRRGP